MYAFRAKACTTHGFRLEGDASLKIMNDRLDLGNSRTRGKEKKKNG
jgi:hypothetical protein